MRGRVIGLGLASIAWTQPASAADTLAFGKAPAWVTPVVVPDKANAPAEAPIAILLSDQQIAFAPGATTIYTDTVIRIQSPQGLSAGNISMGWNPATDSVTVNKLNILRGGEVIDVLASGQTFTTMRRESSLELATLDGMLTANIQPEGLQVGDSVELATTIERRDPVTGPHVESLFATWNDAPIALGHASLRWPESMKLTVRQSPELPAARRSTRDGQVIVELSAKGIEPVTLPDGAPARFQIGRIGQASTFADWSELAALMKPLFRTAAVIPQSGPLRDEVNKIAAQSSDPAVRAAKALSLVEDRVRYVALLMGEGGYVPAPAETTWSRRFGDCKAKSALLLAVLHALGIEAEPVLVSSTMGDAVASRLPMMSAFDHVLVRARIGGATYWLDGTRTGDSTLELLDVPAFGWGLPLVEDAKLVRIMPGPAETPQSETHIAVDARKGIYAAVPVTVSLVYRGDLAVALNGPTAAMTRDQRSEFLRGVSKKYFDEMTIASSSLNFDPAKREMRIGISGAATLDWGDGWYRVPSASIGYTPDFERTTGPNRDAPFAAAYPLFVSTDVSLQLPPGFADSQTLNAPVKETLAGAAYVRTVTRDGDTIHIATSTRSLMPEVPYEQALASAPRLKALADDDVYLRLPDGYRASESDVSGLAASKPASVQAFIDRGIAYLNSGKLDEALADFTEVLKQEPKNQWALANRGIVHLYQKHPELAEKDFVAVQAINPDNYVAARGRGMIAQSRSDWQAAADAYTRSLQVQNDSSFTLVQRATVYRAMGEDEKALADLDHALKLDEQPHVRLMRANILLAEGDLAGVAHEADEMVSRSPGETFALVSAARIYARLGKTDKAIAAFGKALAIKPEPYIYLNRAQTRPVNDLAGRLADVELALKLEPAFTAALAEKAQIFADSGKRMEAITLYDKAIATDPTWKELVYGRAIQLYKLGRKAEAEKAFADDRPSLTSATDFNHACRMKAFAGIMLESALKDCDEALKIDPAMGAALDSRGMTLLRLGRLDEALAAYDKAVAKKMGAESLMGRAIVQARRGDIAAARADQAEALKRDPAVVDRFARQGLTLDDQKSVTSQ